MVQQTPAVKESANSIVQTFADSFNNFINQLPGIGLGILIIILGVLLASWLGGFVRKRISANTNDPLMSRFLGKAIKWILVSIAIMLALRSAGLGGIATAILTAAGASVVVLGFAFKDIAENFLAGIILAFNRPYRVDDTVKIGENFGKVKSLEFRYTKLKTFDGRDVYIPNSDVLTEPVTNYTEDGFFRWDFVVGIAYEDDVEGAKKSIYNALSNEPNVIKDDDHENFVAEEELATNTVNLRVYFWVETTDFRRLALITKGDVIRRVKEGLTQDGYNMPANIQELKLYSTQKAIPLNIEKINPEKKLKSKA